MVIGLNDHGSLKKVLSRVERSGVRRITRSGQVSYPLLNEAERPASRVQWIEMDVSHLIGRENVVSFHVT